MENPIQDFHEFIKSDLLHLSWIVPSPVHLVAILASYLFFILKAGPQYMSNRKPYDLKKTIMAYNIFQIAFNIYIMYLYLKIMNGKIFNYGCRPVAVSSGWTKDVHNNLANGMHYYYVNKLTDLLDTVFFVLRKKQSQVTFLHLYHHISMVASTWLSVYVVQQEPGVVLAAVNVFVHIIMYTYYFLSAFGPGIQKYLWWKKYLTLMQIVQFTLGFAYFIYLHFYLCCVFNKLIVHMWCVNGAVYLYLFINFYRQSYNTNKAKTT